MGKKRRRRSGGQPGGFWRQEYGGAPMWFLVGAIALIAVFGAVGVNAVLSQPSAQARPQQPVPTFSFGSDSRTEAPQARITLPAAGSATVFFGDSWTQGYAANPETSGYAYLVGQAFGWNNAVLGVGSTGYVNPGVPGTSYADRSAALTVDESVSLVVVQGSINDVWIDSATYPDLSLDNLPGAASTTLTNLRTAYPNAQIIGLGPTPPYLPASAGVVKANDILKTVFSEAGLSYVDTTGWITTDNISTVIDANADNHPSTDGHAYLAEQVEAALRGLAGE